MTLIRLSDLFTYGRSLLFPGELVSLYRYVEHIIEIALVKKYNRKNILEIGPGVEPFLKYIELAPFESVTVLDYQGEFIEGLARTLSQKNNREIIAITANIDTPSELTPLKKHWDCIIANALLEHLQNDEDFVRQVENVLSPGGIFVGTTVLSPWLYNKWDRAVGHYRRYSTDGLMHLFRSFEKVQIIQTSLVQELVRPLFFSRIRHLESSALEENNQYFNEEQEKFGSPPFPSLYHHVQKLFPLYLVIDWILKDIQGGIGIVIAKKHSSENR